MGMFSSWPWQSTLYYEIDLEAELNISVSTSSFGWVPDLMVQSSDLSVTLHPRDRAHRCQTDLDLKTGTPSCTLDQGPNRAEVGERLSSR